MPHPHPRKKGKFWKGVGRVGAALATGGASEIAILAARQAKGLLRGARMFPHRRDIGRIRAGHLPVKFHHRPGAPPRRPPPPPPPGRIHPQRRMLARARAGHLRHIRQEDIES